MLGFCVCSLNTLHSQNASQQKGVQWHLRYDGETLRKAYSELLSLPWKAVIRLEAYVTFEERFCFTLFLCEVKSPKSEQVKLSAIEIKVQFTLLLGNFEHDSRLLMSDLSNLLRAKESMARNHSDSNWSRKFQYEPLMKVMLRSILHWTKFPDNISKLFLKRKRKERTFSAHTTTVVNGGRQIWMDINHVRTKSLIIQKALMLLFLQARRILEDPRS